MDLQVVSIGKPEDVNLILGQSHFIKTVEDLHEALVSSVPAIRFGLAFCESSGPALVRWSGNDDELVELARNTMAELGAGHAFLILLRNDFPINVLPAVRAVQDVCQIYCATANRSRWWWLRRNRGGGSSGSSTESVRKASRAIARWRSGRLCYDASATSWVERVPAALSLPPTWRT